MKKSICFALILMLMLSVSFTAFAVESGECGNAAAWSFDETTGTLTISGQGAMYDYEQDYNIPWYSWGRQIKAIVIEPGITYVGRGMFYNCAAESLSLPEGLEVIGANAFAGTNITALTIPESVHTIGNGAFSGCSKLAGELDVSHVTNLGSAVFEFCELLTKVILPADMTEIPDGLFSYCTSLNELDIPDSVTVVGENAFVGTGITSVELPAGLTGIGDMAFSYCENLESLQLPGALKAIGSKAFQRCIKLEEVIVPEGVTQLGRGAFESCNGLVSVALPASLTSSLDAVFIRCSSLKTVNIPSGVTEIGESAFAECTALEFLQIPEGVTRIHMSAFRGCTALVEITLPDSLTRIDSSAFESCTSLEELTIPQNVTCLGKWFAQHCESLKLLRVLNPECEFELDFYPSSKDLGIPGVTVICSADNSTAQAYAERFNFPFMILGTEGPGSRLYSDVQRSDWFYEAVKYVSQHQIMKGTGNNAFSPNEPMTRAMVVTVLHRFANTPEVFDFNPFVDVPRDSYYYDGVTWAFQVGVVAGTDETHFAPNSTITREQLAAILFRFYSRVNIDSNRADLSSFPDADDVSSYAQEAMSWAVAKGLINGVGKTDGNYLDPHGTATRAQVAAVIMRYREMFSSK